MATKVSSRKAAELRHKPRATMKSPKTPLKSSLKEFLEWVAVSGKEIPEVERARIPTDLAKNHEHYLYGHPKQDT